jgi:hypothetical protein
MNANKTPFWLRPMLWLLGPALIGLSLWCTFNLYTGFADNSKDAATWAGIGLGLDSFKNIALVTAVSLWALRGFVARLLSGVMVLAYLVLFGLSLSAFFGFMSQVQHNLESQAARHSAEFEQVRQSIVNAERRMESLAAFGGRESALAGELSALRADYAEAQAELAKYANPDGTPKTNARGVPFTTKAGEAAGRVSALQGRLAQAEQAVRQSAAFETASRQHQAYIEQLGKLEAEASGNYVHPMFVMLGKLLRATPEDTKIGFMFISALLAEVLGALAILIATLLKAGPVEPSPVRPKRYSVEDLKGMEAMLKSFATALQGGNEPLPRARVEYSHGLEDAVAGNKRDNRYATGEARAAYNAGFDDGERQRRAQPKAQQAATPDVAAVAPATEAVAPGLPDDALLTGDADYRGQAEPQLVSPWMRKRDIVMIHAYEGAGKSLLAFGIAKMLTDGGEMFGGKWRCPQPLRVLYVDSEMGRARVQQRKQDMGLEHGRFSCLSYDALPPEHFPNICTEAGQRVIDHYIAKTLPAVIVLDSLAILSDGMFRSDTAWGQFQAWLKRLQNRGIGVIIVHHDNKQGEQDGKQNNNRLLATRIQLVAKPGVSKGDGLVVDIHYRKHRDFHGEDTESFAARFQDGEWECYNEPAQPLPATATTRVNEGATGATVAPVAGNDDIVETMEPPKTGTNRERVLHLVDRLAAAGVEATPAMIEKITSRNGRPINRGTAHRLMRNAARDGEQQGFML